MSIADNTDIILTRLGTLGIPASCRNASNTLYNWKRDKYVDVIAHGIVQIEAKVCFEIKQKYPQWNNIATVDKDDIVILVDLTEGNDDWYIFRNNDPVFYHPDKIEKGTNARFVGMRKQGVILGHRSSKSFEKAKNRWSLIEEVKKEKITDMQYAYIF